MCRTAGKSTLSSIAPSTRFHRDPQADQRAQFALVALLQRCGADRANL
jgi:hypothetical protein